MVKIIKLFHFYVTSWSVGRAVTNIVEGWEMMTGVLVAVIDVLLPVKLISS